MTPVLRCLFLLCYIKLPERVYCLCYVNKKCHTKRSVLCYMQMFSSTNTAQRYCFFLKYARKWQKNMYFFYRHLIYIRTYTRARN